ncbi:hypothetical protein FOC4_g10001340 [Fusarium odoratissimum]|uniref:Transcription factor domain-containing protein n=1 Tax=Fusarium oxysporum f. sp. cubense (strain race 4) TaxID=2502994 RepID=N1S4A3_FUSC4|nr:hypothetical protein FOC4_g10001340 [Fusarium odoratissimum]
MVWLETVENWIFQGPDFNEDIVPQTDDDNQSYQVLQRLDIVQAAYAIVLLINWEGNTKARLRARRTRFPDIVYVARSLYPFAMPGTTTDEHFSASDAEAWFMSTQAAENRAVACSQVTLSQSLSMIMTEDCGATQMSPLNLFAIANAFHSLIYHHQNGPDQGSRSLAITQGLRNWFRICLSFVGVMKPIQPRHSSKVNIETLMMTIMTIGCATKEVEATMNGCRLDELPSHKRPHGQDVSSEQYGREDNGNCVGYNMLDGMCIL